MISARIDKPISSEVMAPRSRPAGALIRSSAAGSTPSAKPAGFRGCFEFSPAAPRPCPAPRPPPGPRACPVARSRTGPARPKSPPARRNRRHRPTAAAAARERFPRLPPAKCFPPPACASPNHWPWRLVDRPPQKRKKADTRFLRSRASRETTLRFVPVGRQRPGSASLCHFRGAERFGQGRRLPHC